MRQDGLIYRTVPAPPSRPMGSLRLPPPTLPHQQQSGVAKKSKHAQTTGGPTATPRQPVNTDSDAMSVASYGESDSNSEYVDSPKNLPTRLANTLQLKIHILELQHMHEVAEDNIDDIAQPTYLFTQPDELDPKELANDGTTMDENHQYNGASPRNVTQPSLSKSPLTYTLVATDEPLPHPCVEDSDATRLSRMEDLPEVLLKVADDELYRVYQNWVHQDPGNNLDGGIKEDGKWKSRWKTCLFANPTI